VENDDPKSIIPLTTARINRLEMERAIMRALLISIVQASLEPDPCVRQVFGLIQQASSIVVASNIIGVDELADTVVE
jgi:hypothetical protein